MEEDTDKLVEDVLAEVEGVVSSAIQNRPYNLITVNEVNAKIDSILEKYLGE